MTTFACLLASFAVFATFWVTEQNYNTLSGSNIAFAPVIQWRMQGGGEPRTYRLQIVAALTAFVETTSSARQSVAVSER